jgi:hypothetical protein
MNKQLKDQLRTLGLLPEDLDELAQECSGETHYSPGTPHEIIRREEEIKQKVYRLDELEGSGRVESEEYRRIESELRAEISRFPTRAQIFTRCVPQLAMTGVCGRNRDNYQ